MIERPKITVVPMTDMVIKAVEDMAKEQGLKSNKFYNRRRELLIPIDLLKGVREENQNENKNFGEPILDGNDPHQGNLPPPEETNVPGKLLSDEGTLEPDDGIDDDELADLLEDGRVNDEVYLEKGDDGELYYVEPSVEG